MFLDDGSEIRLHRAVFTKAVLARIEANYPGIRTAWDEDPHRARIVLDHLDAGMRSKILTDLRFYDLNPTIPLESLCVHLDTYHPRNESQEELLRFAYKLATLDNPDVGAGLYMYGEAGIGKSHVAIGISKVFMERGLEPHYMVADTYHFNTPISLEANQVWVLDDVNTGYGMISKLFKSVILNVHDRGGRLFVTSNKDYSDLMREMFVGDSEANRIRYEDRTKGMFRILRVTGDSHRQEHAWWRE